MEDSSCSVGLGFTSISSIFVNFPLLFRDVFAANCVALVFIVALVANLVLHEEMSVDGSEGTNSKA